MNGNVVAIMNNYSGKRSYGFILGEDNQEYFFHKSQLINCSIFRLQEGDSVEFTPVLDKKSRKKQAENIRQRTTFTSDQYANPGIHRDVDINSFNQDEEVIVKALGCI